MMKILLVMISLVVLGLAWRISGMLSPDAIAMAIGLLIGVLAGLPTAALVLLARRRDDEDDDEEVYERGYVDGTCQPIDNQPIVHADQVTPYYRLARQALGFDPLPTR
jgi:hypothetical protein